MSVSLNVSYEPGWLSMKLTGATVSKDLEYNVIITNSDSNYVIYSDDLSFIYQERIPLELSTKENINISIKTKEGYEIFNESYVSDDISEEDLTVASVNIDIKEPVKEVTTTKEIKKEFAETYDSSVVVSSTLLAVVLFVIVRSTIFVKKRKR